MTLHRKRSRSSGWFRQTWLDDTEALVSACSCCILLEHLVRMQKKHIWIYFQKRRPLRMLNLGECVTWRTDSLNFICCNTGRGAEKLSNSPCVWTVHHFCHRAHGTTNFAGDRFQTLLQKDDLFNNDFQQNNQPLLRNYFAVTFLKPMRQFCLQNFITLSSIRRDGHWLSVP